MKRYGGIHTVLFLALAGLVACGDVDGPARGIDERASRAMIPDDPALAEIYNRSCRRCHTEAATGAPLTGDSEAWSVRMNKGMDVLVANTVNGIGRMPALGFCMSCDAVEFEALIRFMASAPPNP